MEWISFQNKENAFEWDYGKCTTDHRIENIKGVNFIICKLHLNKAVLKRAYYEPGIVLSA